MSRRPDFVSPDVLRRREAREARQLENDIEQALKHLASLNAQVAPEERLAHVQRMIRLQKTPAYAAAYPAVVERSCYSFMTVDYLNATVAELEPVVKQLRLERGVANAAELLQKRAYDAHAIVQKFAAELAASATPDRDFSWSGGVIEASAIVDVARRLTHVVEVTTERGQTPNEIMAILHEEVQNECQRRGMNIASSTSPMSNFVDDCLRVAWFKAKTWLACIEAGQKFGLFE